MSGTNHIIGGVVFTGIWGGILGINILASPWYIFSCVLGSLIPDIDRPGAIIARLPILSKLASWFNRKYGHRTITHSLIALTVVTVLVKLLCLSFGVMENFTMVFFLGYCSHLIYDMMTLAGVPLLYPFYKNPCVIPGKPEMRFRSSDLRTETMIFSFFLLCLIFFQPLMANGFWTQYNRAFGTLTHLFSEYNKTTDLLEVDYTYKIGSEEFQGTAFVIEAFEKKATLLEDGKFKFLDNSIQQAIDVYPTHTKRKFRFENKSFVSIDSDSLIRLTVDSMIMQIELSSNNTFATSTFQRGSKFKGNYLTQFFVEEIQESRGEVEKFVSTTNPRIATLRERILNLEEEQRFAQNGFHQLETAKHQLEVDLSKEEDLYKREKLLQKIKDVEKEMDKAFDNGPKVKELKSQIRELRESDRIKNQEKRLKIEQKNRENEIEETRFSGIIKYLIIN